MSRFAGRQAYRRVASAVVASAVVASVVLFGAIGHAEAEDGVSNFLSSIFGGGQNPAPASTQAPQGGVVEDSPQYTSRPLTVKLHRPKTARAAPLPTKPVKVSIFEDKTLRRGDAVMTGHGMRIFAGSSNWPYQSSDFVAISNAGGMDKSIQKTLISLDSLPRN